jgi:hypothetical protein
MHSGSSLDLRLAEETSAEAEHAVLELTALLDGEVIVTEIILQALEARIVGLKKVVQLCWLLVVAGWVRGCARLYGVHSPLPFCGPGPGVRQHLRGHFSFRHTYFTYLLYIYNPYVVQFDENT